MSRVASGNLLVSGVLRVPAHVAGSDIQHSLHMAESIFHALEAASGEIGFLFRDENHGDGIDAVARVFGRKLFTFEDMSIDVLLVILIFLMLTTTYSKFFFISLVNLFHSPK